MKKTLLCLVMTAFCFTSCHAGVKSYKVQVVKEYPHDSGSYTQGLFFHNGQLFESTGQYGQSTFRKINLETGEALERIDFSKKYFAEGSVILGDKLYILTWENKVAFIYDANTLKYEQTYSYPRPGWGITTDGKQLIASDGSSKLYFMDDKFQVKNTITVKLNGRPVTYLNELEYIDGKIWANVYLSDVILIINPKTGEVEGSIDCTGLLPDKYRDADTDVLNGIAVNPDNGKIYLTGKNWKRLYEIKLVDSK